MNVSQAVARAYAEALMDLAEEQGNLGRIVDDLHAVQELYDNDAAFRSFFVTHRIERDVKKQVLNEALKDKIDRPVLGLLHLLVDRQRELVLDNIVDEFDRYKDIREGRLHAYVTTARALDEELKADITRRLEGATGQSIVLHERVEPGVIGGIAVKLGDRVIDGTVKRRLDRLRRTLVSHR